MNHSTKKGAPCENKAHPNDLAEQQYKAALARPQHDDRLEMMASLIRLARSCGFPVVSADELTDTMSLEGGATCQQH